MEPLFLCFPIKIALNLFMINEIKNRIDFVND